MKTLACPPVAEWNDFDSGVLSGARHDELAEHLDSCAECAARFEALESRPDGVVAQLREQLPPEVVADDSDLNLLVARAAALQQTGAEEAGDTHADAASQRQVKVVEWLPQVLAPAQGADELGRLAGYRVLRVLGMGGMGVVLLAEDISLKRMVALKVMNPTIMSSSARARFLREAQSNAAVRQDNVVTIFQVGEDRGVPFLAMELLEGESLADRLQSEQKLSVGEALRITHETAQGLAAAHAKGLTHRDIKPDNIWLEGKAEGQGLRGEGEDRGTKAQPAAALAPQPSALSQSRVKLLDFGLARAVDDEQGLTQEGAIVGTPNYLSPEQAGGAAVDARTDLFSLGVVLYEMLSGRKPFAQATLMATLKSITLDPPREMEANVPVEVAALVKRLLEKRAEDRFASCSELIAAIERCQQALLRPRAASEPLALATGSGESDAQEPDASAFGSRKLAAASRKWAPRRTWIATAAAAALVLMFGVIVTIKDKNGKTLLRYLVPDGGTVEVASDKREPLSPEFPADRAAAKWVLSIGGGVSVQTEGDVRDFKNLDDLPERPFKLWAINLTSNPQLTDVGLANLKGLTNLKKLTLQQTALTDAGVEHLQELGSVETLNLSKTRITDAALVRLARLSNLKLLHLGGTDVSDAGLVHLAKIPQLETLLLWRTDVTDAGMPHLAALSNLKFLEVAATDVTDVGVAHLANLKQLTHLTIGPSVTDAVWPYLKEMTNLAELEMNYAKISDRGLEHVKELKQLKSLNLNVTPLTDAGLVHLMSLPNLTRLEAAGTRVTDVGIERLKELSGLTSLGLADTNVTVAGVGQLKKSLPNCEVRYGPLAKLLVAPAANRVVPTYTERQAADWALGCGGTVTLKLRGGGSALVANIQELPAGNVRLLRIDLTGRGDKVTDAGLEHVRGLRDLTHLYLKDTRVTDFGLDHVSGLSTLVDLRLTGTLVTDAGLERLEKLTPLKGLSLAGTSVTDHGLNLLQGLNDLADLQLADTQISDAGLETIVKLPALIILDVSAPRVTDAGLCVLKAHDRWKKLDIRCPKITDAGLEHLAGFTQLETLTLKCPKVTPAGVAKLQQSLPNCKITR